MQEFDPNNLVCLYHGRNEEVQGDKWRFIELSLGNTLLISSTMITIPDGDPLNRNKYIMKPLENDRMSRYLYKQDNDYGVWDCGDKCFYEYDNQEDFKEEFIEFLMEHTILSYNTPRQRSRRFTLPVIISKTDYDESV